MNQPPIIIAFTVVIVIIALLLVLVRQRRATPTCPNCESSDVVEASREAVGTRKVQFPTGSPGGGVDIRLQLDFDVKFNCRNCNRPFVKRITQTQ